MAQRSGLPTKPPFDKDLPVSTWSWLKYIWQWIKGEADVTPSNTASLTLNDSYFYPFDATSGNLIATLPPANTCFGKKYVIKKTDASANTVSVTADTTAPDLIDGVATKVINARYYELQIESDGVSNWHIIGFYTAATLGTVTSVGLTMPTEYIVASTPITTSGTFGVTWNNETANTVLAGPY